MNYLAHLFLADDTPESLAGNLAGDFVKGALGDRFTPGIRAGIRQHRCIDAFTDSHPAVGAFRRVLTPDFGHYSRIIADVFFDHFLSLEWPEYASGSIPDFLAHVYASLDPLADQLPGRLPLVYPRLRDENWLLSYGSVEGIHTALFHLSKRVRRDVHLERATPLLTSARRELVRGFHAFFPDVIRCARDHTFGGDSLW